MRFLLSAKWCAVVFLSVIPAVAQVTVNLGSHDPNYSLENTGGGGEFGYLFIDPNGGIEQGGQTSGGVIGSKLGITLFGPGNDIPYGYRITQVDVSIEVGNNATSDDVTIYLETSGNAVELTGDPFSLSATNTMYAQSITTTLLSSSSEDELYFALINRGTDEVQIRDVTLTVYASAVPEPASAAVWLGLAGFLWATRRRRR